MRDKSNYEGSNAKKEDIGVFVTLVGGDKLLFNEAATWKWRTIAKRLALEVREDGKIRFHAWADNVLGVGGPQVLFRDSEWKVER